MTQELKVDESKNFNEEEEEFDEKVGKEAKEEEEEEPEEEEPEEEEQQEEGFYFFQPLGGPIYLGNDLDFADRLILHLRFCINKGQPPSSSQQSQSQAQSQANVSSEIQQQSQSQQQQISMSEENWLTTQDEEYLRTLEEGTSSDLQYPLDLLINNISSIYTYAIDNKQIEFIFDCALAALPGASNFRQNADKLSEALTLQDAKFADLNLRILTNLFNYLPEESGNNLRPLVMQRLLSLVLKSPLHTLTKLMKGKMEDLKSWMKEWDVKGDVKKNLLESAWQIARRNRDDDMAQDFLIEYLKEWKSGDNVTDDVMNIASQAVIAAISTEKINTHTFMELAKLHIVREMKENEKYRSKYSELYELLMIVYQGTVKDFRQFVSKNEAILKSLSLEIDNLLAKMRKLTLCGIGNHYTNIGFAELKEQLQVETLEELEELIIELVTQNLLNAKIDHANEQVQISRSTLRVFDRETWDRIAEKLSLWQHNTDTVIQIMQTYSSKERTKNQT